MPVVQQRMRSDHEEGFNLGEKHAFNPHAVDWPRHFIMRNRTLRVAATVIVIVGLITVITVKMKARKAKMLSRIAV